jgi:hypothetical protein
VITFYEITIVIVLNRTVKLGSYANLGFKQGEYAKLTHFLIRIKLILGFLDPDPDPAVRGKDQAGSGSFYNQAKIVKKP